MNTVTVRKAIADVIADESLPVELWAKLPRQASGAEWVGEAKDMANRVLDYLYGDTEDEVSEDYLRDLVGEVANGECEDYYRNIHDRVTRLNLWAISELDDEVTSLNSGVTDYPTMTDLEGQYLYAMASIVWLAVVEYITETVEELEEVNA